MVALEIIMLVFFLQALIEEAQSKSFKALNT